ncbi:MAG: ribonuclease [Hydrogenophilales bacterium CG_4_8_14_3_um_filter_62_83]|nr:MAG: ribonuclease [Hydrogenophilales bacterium CG15_BIG_FIL_POST_REV_8_21_14_020_62_31]PIW71302.1 MAG: ribonuclease [Hydrogenophilales bacterium CG12_big_fil_rev_8_21_14_0_65_61_21]PIX02078.1 MAG: ribonuclease [Hydrogenophilales bacterium CG_4_8_14_3_um_filter_62_83]PIY97966.1 MAG: ribonuclease [Hydrogenophilales bacterium CG_4_10_14_0_8_um_filter_62_70]
MTHNLLIRLILVAFLGLLAWGGAQGFWNGAANKAPTTTHITGLPPEARQTLDRIKRGGPFPYGRDGIVFQNRENRLPPKPRGYYHEYTVPTPGARDRGARRIIVGPPGEYYYTQDHYRSFWRIQE